VCIREQRVEALDGTGQVERADPVHLLERVAERQQEAREAVLGHGAGARPGHERRLGPGRMHGHRLKDGPTELARAFLGERHRRTTVPAFPRLRHDFDADHRPPRARIAGHVEHDASDHLVLGAHEPAVQRHVGLLGPRRQHLLWRSVERICAVECGRHAVAHADHRTEVGRIRRIRVLRYRERRDRDRHAGLAHARTFFHAPAYETGTKPIASLMSSMWRFSSALNVDTRGDSGAISRHRSRLVHLMMTPRR